MKFLLSHQFPMDKSWNLSCKLLFEMLHILYLFHNITCKGYLASGSCRRVKLMTHSHQVLKKKKKKYSLVFPFTVSPSLSPSPSLSAPCCQRSFLKVYVINGVRRWRGGNGGRCYVWRCVCMNVCVRVCACQWGTGALAVSEKTAGSIWGRLIGQLGTVSMWHAAVNLLSSFHCLSLSLSLSFLSAFVSTTILSVSSSISSPFSSSHSICSLSLTYL